MDKFILLRNALISSIDQKSVEPVPNKPMKNTLKTFVNFGTVNRVTPNIYGKVFTIDIPKTYDNLAELYIKSTLATDSVSSTVESMFGTRVFSKIVLRTKKGTVLQTVIPQYTQARIAEINDTPLYTKIAAAIEPSGAFLDGPVTVITPLFCFFSENVSCFLNTRNYEQLELELTINSDFDSMGMGTPLSSASFDFFGLFHDVNTSSSITDHILTSKPDITKQLVGSYNIFQEDDVIVSDSSTYARILLRNPHPAFAMHLSLTDPSANTKQINRVRLTIGNRVILDIDNLMNFTLYGTHRGYIPDLCFTYFFSKLKDRSVDSGLLVFSKEMAPCFLEVWFSADASPTGVNYTLKTLMEHRTNYIVSSIGDISLSNDVNFLDEGFYQTNSIQAPADLTGTG